MFNKIIITFVLLCTTLFAEIDFQRAMIYKADINSKTAYEMQQNGVQIIDVRTKREYKDLHPKDSINIPIFNEKNGQRVFNKNFVNEIHQILKENMDKKVILICRSGSRTKLASNFLAYQGFKNVYNVTNGFQYDWIRVNLPTEK